MQEKATLQYAISGKLLVYRQKGLGTSFQLRNVIALAAFEMKFLLFSCLILLYAVSQHSHLRECLRTTQYFLRDLPPAKSLIRFRYVRGEVNFTIIQKLQFYSP